MVQKITIENFFSIADKQEIDLRVPTNSPELPCFLAAKSDPGYRLPVVAGFFGANASGKSTVLRAVTTAAWFAVYSFSLAPNTQIPLFNPYARNDWWDLPTKIAIDFDGRIAQEEPFSLFRYELHIANDKDKFGKHVNYEALSYSPQGRFRRLFERNEQNFKFGNGFGISENDSRVQSIRPNASIISTLAQFNHKLSIDFISSLNGLQSNISGLDKYNSGLEHLLNYYLNNQNYLDELNYELCRLDLGLEEMKIAHGPTGPFAIFKHNGLDCEILWVQESTGTRRFIEIFPRIKFVLNNGGIAIIDELDNDIHPFILPELLNWFYDKNINKNGAQLLFSAHNPTILDELEKEQVFFTEKPSGEPTIIYGAGEIKGLRRDGTGLMKRYLSGELGAVPHIG